MLEWLMTGYTKHPYIGIIQETSSFLSVELGFHDRLHINASHAKLTSRLGSDIWVNIETE